MKTVLLSSIGLALMVLAAACGSDNGDGFIDGGGGGDGGDGPAPFPEQREGPLIDLARSYVDPQLPVPNQDVVYDVRYEDPGRAAEVVVTGLFADEGPWLEKQAEVGFSYADGEWVVRGWTGFYLTEDEEGRQQELATEATAEAGNQARIEELTGTLEAFDKIVVSDPKVEKISSAGDIEEGWFEGLRFLINVENPTDNPHRIEYDVKWGGESFSPTTDACPPNYREREPFDELQAQVIVEVGALENKVGEFQTFEPGFCVDYDIKYAETIVTSIDGYTGKGQVEAEIKQLQTSSE